MNITMTALRAQLLGAARIELATKTVDFAPDKRYQLLAYLAHRGDWVRRDELAHLFWPEVVDKAARHSLRQLLKRVRKLEWLTGLEADAQRVRWRVETDVAAFEEALAAADWKRALSAYGGPLLGGMGRASSEFEDWLMLEREHLHGHWREALFRHAGQLEARGEHLEAAALLDRLLRHDELDEDALRSYMSALARAGRREQALRAYRGFAERLRRELDLRPTTATEQLAEGVRSGEGSSLPLSASAQPPAVAVRDARPTLPAPVTSFVGRDLELSSIAHHLSQADCRLLTLTGLGGVGKSRLALQAAEELGRRYPDGVSFVPLEALDSVRVENPQPFVGREWQDFRPEVQALPTAIASALGLTLQGKDDASRQLKRHLENKRILLVLDNFEHLVNGAELLAELLHACPGLELLVTSRERLGLEEEWLLPIEGLAVPEAGAPLEDALSYDAVKLLVQRARRVLPDFALSAADLEHVRTICRLVAGLPLGIELAAVWLRLMPLEELAGELEKSLDLLASSSRNAAARQQSLRAVFEHSWALLSVKEQEVLKKLAVFRGGFRREAAALVAGASVAVLAALVDKSLLRVLPNGRYDRHPLIYGYIREKLAERPDEQAAVQARHQSYYVRLLAQQAAAIGQGRQREALRAVYEEWENIHSVLRRSASAATPDELVQWVELMEVAFEARGYLAEGLEFLTQAEAALDEADPDQRAALGRVVLEQAWYCLRLSRYDEAAALAERGLSLAKPAGRAGWLARGHNTLGAVALHTGRREEAERGFRLALRLAERAGEHALAASAVGNLAIRAHDAGDYELAETLYLEALTRFRRQGRYSGVVTNLGNLGHLYMALARWRQAERVLQEGLELARSYDFRHSLPYLLTNLSHVAETLGQLERAQELNEEALELAEAEGNAYVMSTILANLSSVTLALADVASATHYAVRAVQTAWSSADNPKLMQGLLALAECWLNQQQTDQAARIFALVRAHPATLAPERQTAERALARLEGAARLEPETASLELLLADVLAHTLADSRT